MPKYKPFNTQIVDPLGVNTSIAARPMEMGSDESRDKIVKETSGEPTVDYIGKTNPYIDYQSIDILLSLQHPRSDGYDEHCFIIIFANIILFLCLTEISSFQNIIHCSDI